MNPEKISRNELAKDPDTVKKVFLLLDGRPDLTPFFKPTQLGQIWEALDKYFTDSNPDDIDHFSIEIDIGEKANDLGWILFHWESVFDENGPTDELTLNPIHVGNGMMGGPGTGGPEYTPTFASGANLKVSWDSLDPSFVQSEINRLEPSGLFEELEMIPYSISA